MAEHASIYREGGGKALKEQSLKPQRFCIFCQGKGLSKEHVWPEWLQSYIPRSYSHTIHNINYSTLNLATGKVEQQEAGLGKLNRNGHPTSQRLRVVCVSCNTGWMSKLQEKAKAIVLPLIVRNWSNINTDKIKLLCSWITMTCIVYEWANESTVTTTDLERQYFKNTQSVLPNWKIWVGKFHDKSQGEFWHTGLHIQHDPITSAGPHKCNTHINTFTIGNLLIHTFAVPHNIAITLPALYNNDMGILPMWPITTLPIDYSLRSLNNQDAFRIATTLRGTLLNEFGGDYV